MQCHIYGDLVTISHNPHCKYIYTYIYIYIYICVCVCVCVSVCVCIIYIHVCMYIVLNSNLQRVLLDAVKGLINGAPNKNWIHS